MKYVIGGTLISVGLLALVMTPHIVGWVHYSWQAIVILATVTGFCGQPIVAYLRK